MKRQQREFMGRRGEDLAVEWMMSRGWRILDRRRRTPVGEIDIVAQDGDCLVFAEVKWRRSNADLGHAIDERGLARIAGAAESVAHEYDGSGGDRRVDVVLISPGQPVRHIANAWQP
jgi:putative endonuclease